MFRFVTALLAGLVGAAIVHIAVVFAMPFVASNNAWGRLDRLGPLFGVVRIEPQLATTGTAGAAGSMGGKFAFVDPAFVTASCRFSLENGPVRLASEARAAFWSASIYSRRGDNLYSINDRSAVGGKFDLLVGTPEQLSGGDATSTDPTETTIPVEFPETYGSLTIRALVDEDSLREQAEAFLRGLSCTSEAERQAEDGAN